MYGLKVADQVLDADSINFNPVTLNHLSRFYGERNRNEEDTKKVIELYDTAVELRHYSAMARLALIYLEEEQDKDKAVHSCHQTRKER